MFFSSALSENFQLNSISIKPCLKAGDLFQPQLEPKLKLQLKLKPKPKPDTFHDFTAMSLYWRFTRNCCGFKREVIDKTGSKACESREGFTSNQSSPQWTVQCAQQHQLGRNPEIPSCSLKSPSHNTHNLLEMSQLN